MKWFKNLAIYQLNKGFTSLISDLETSLLSHVFVPCGNQEKIKLGWISPFGEQHALLHHHIDGHYLLCMQKEDKQLSAAVINRYCQQKIDKFEQMQHRKLKKTEKATLKDETIQELLPRAFTRITQTWIWIDSNNDLIMIDTASSKTAEDALTLLRKCIGTLPVIPLTPKTPLSTTLTNWVLTDDIPSPFSALDEIELKTSEKDGAIITCKHQEIISDEITTHIKNGKHVSRIRLNWIDKMHFTLYDNAAIKQLRYLDIEQENHETNESQENSEKLDTDFFLMISELSKFIQNLNKILQI